MTGKVDDELRRNEAERDDLLRSISQVEAALAASTPGTRDLLKRFIEGAKGRVGTLDGRIKEIAAERDTRERGEVMLARIAQDETRLSAEEKETFDGFLRKRFFTKSDFASLEKFYANAWDRLSDKGKYEMSARVWSGIRRGEYEFSELPQAVREKEEEQAYKRLRNATIGGRDEARIPVKDREDFLNLYESNAKGEAAKVLDRPSFKQEMFKGAAMNDRSITKDLASQPNAAEKLLSDGKSKEDGQPGPLRLDAAESIDNLEMSGVKLADAPESISAQQIHTNRTGRGTKVELG